VSSVRYELGFYIPENEIRLSQRRENLKSYIASTGWTLQRRRIVSSVRNELGFYIPEDAILHSHRRENLKSYAELPLSMADVFNNRNCTATGGFPRAVFLEFVSHTL
jgi:hypothetical protein